VGCDMAWKAKAAAHSRGEKLKNSKITHMWWSAFGQTNVYEWSRIPFVSNDVRILKDGPNTSKRISLRKFEPIICCKHPIIASGATPIRSAGRAPDRKICNVEISCAGKRLWSNSKKHGAYTRINKIRL
jgi:hypothetical protein